MAREMLFFALWLSDTDEARKVLARAGAPAELQSRSTSLLAREIDQGLILDLLWLHYMATGDPAPVFRIISALKHMNDFGAAKRFAASKQTPEDRARAMNDAIFQSASWSLESLGKEHAPLRAIYERAFDDPRWDPTTRVALALVLEKLDPAKWKVTFSGNSAQIQRS